MQNGIAIHMLTEKKYPLSQEMFSKMLKNKLEVDHESSQAFELLWFIRSQEKELILLMVKAADLEISMHGDYYGMLAKFCSRPGKEIVSENKLLCCVPDTAYGPHMVSWICLCRAGQASKPSFLQDLAHLSDLYFKGRNRSSLIMFEFSLCLLADSTINLVSDSSIFVLRSGYEEFPLFRW
ncbi:hypothetical protein Tco_1265717 [Tanacetum coccineum]